jgi:rod shape determining protein RodA
MKHNVRRWLNQRWAVLDKPMLWMLAGLMCIGMLNMWSATAANPAKFFDQLRNFAVAFMVMWILAHIPPQALIRFAIPAYLLGVMLLIGVALFGEVSKGSRRWLYVGTRIQPSEISKIAVPLMLAWYFSKHESLLRVRDFFIAGILLLVPFLLIARQPDLGTALLVGSAGFYIIYFAGLNFKVILSAIALVVIGVGSLFYYKNDICPKHVKWPLIEDYQKERICTNLKPENTLANAREKAKEEARRKDKNFHTDQAKIAVGSGGLVGKGFMSGTQSQLQFIPEHSTDFAYAVFAEEWGFLGSLVLIGFYIALLLRGLLIATHAPTLFTRLLSGSLILIIFTYTVVNMGMVIGLLPVVGVPMPFISYGGTALLTLGVACGILMSVQRHRSLVQS